MHIQPRTKQKKIQFSARAVTKLYDAIARDAVRWDCSKSWVAITALAAFYDIDVAKPYIAPVKARARRRA